MDINGLPHPAHLASLLASIEANDKKYIPRYRLVLQAVALANDLGYEAGFRIDPQEPEWPVAFIELPTGQVSWHLPQFSSEWDGHTDAMKYARCRRFIERCNATDSLTSPLVDPSDRMSDDEKAGLR